MAINKATLAKVINNTVEYIYPKTTADLVGYGNNFDANITNAKEALDSIIDLSIELSNNKANISDIPIITSSNTNGYIKVNNNELQVYNDNNLSNI